MLPHQTGDHASAVCGAQHAAPAGSVVLNMSLVVLGCFLCQYPWQVACVKVACRFCMVTAQKHGTVCCTCMNTLWQLSHNLSCFWNPLVPTGSVYCCSTAALIFTVLLVVCLCALCPPVLACHMQNHQRNGTSTASTAHNPCF